MTKSPKEVYKILATALAFLSDQNHYGLEVAISQIHPRYWMAKVRENLTNAKHFSFCSKLISYLEQDISRLHKVCRCIKIKVVEGIAIELRIIRQICCIDTEFPFTIGLPVR